MDSELLQPLLAPRNADIPPSLSGRETAINAQGQSSRRSLGEDKFGPVSKPESPMISCGYEALLHLLWPSKPKFDAEQLLGKRKVSFRGRTVNHGCDTHCKFESQIAHQFSNIRYSNKHNLLTASHEFTVIGKKKINLAWTATGKDILDYRLDLHDAATVGHGNASGIISDNDVKKLISTMKIFLRPRHEVDAYYSTGVKHYTYVADRGRDIYNPPLELHGAGTSCVGNKETVDAKIT